MFTKALLPDTVRAVKLVSNIPTIGRAYLAGGTALALHLGHRISVDLDFFSQSKFNEQALSAELSKLKEFKEEGKSWQTVWGWIGKTKFSIFYYKYPLIENILGFKGIQIAGKKDIAAMKVHALEERGTKRDFIDTYFLATEFSLEEMFKFYDKKYSVFDEHAYSIIRALSYFEDAEKEDYTPRMLTYYNWQGIKNFFEKEAVRLAKKFL